jgi:hypothetical protein
MSINYIVTFVNMGGGFYKIGAYTEAIIKPTLTIKTCVLGFS